MAQYRLFGAGHFVFVGGPRSASTTENSKACRGKVEVSPFAG